jgi:hypothetical protein
MTALTCANPGCPDMRGCSEWRLRRGRCCSECEMARYCSRLCQLQGWGQHAGACGALREGMG